MHLTRIHLRPNIQFFEYSAACLSDILVTSWFDSVCVTVTCCVNFREKHLHKHELQLSDYNVKVYLPKCTYFWYNFFFAILLKFIFMVKSKTCK